MQAFFGSYPLEHSTEPIDGWPAWRPRPAELGAIPLAPHKPTPA